MGVLGQTYRFVASNLINNPSGSAGFVLFSLGFALIAGNAVLSQPQTHPEPIWKTTDRTVTRSVVEDVAVVNKPVSITRSVLTQRISLKNIPVPTANPVRANSGTSQSELVREFQAVLAEAGLYSGKIDGIFGSGTRQAIISYQQSAGILPDGEANYGLLAHIQASHAAAKRAVEATPQPKPESTLEPKPQPTPSTVSIGTPKNTEFDRQTILRIQAGLKEKFGETDIDVDGVFGTQTRNALIRFQEFFQLEPSGEIDRKTMEKLLSAGIIRAI